MHNMFIYEFDMGKICVEENGVAVTNLYFYKEAIPQNTITKETDIIKEARVQLLEYFNGKRKSFTLPLAPQGTAFQQKVWKVLQSIPYGETWSYKQVAEAIGQPKASRAVGMANNKNPLPIFIPCHRVIGANGKLVGYAGGLDVKEYLLKLERAQVLKGEE